MRTNENRVFLKQMYFIAHNGNIQEKLPMQKGEFQ